MSKTIFYIFPCLFFFSCAHNLNPYSVDNKMSTMINETRTIMQELEIPLRKPIDTGDSIQFAANHNLNGLNAVFHFKSTLYISENGHIDSSSRSYEAPLMIVSYQLLDIINRSIDTSKSAYVQTKGVIIHELTHYLQATIGGKNYIKPSLSQFKDYLTQPNEFEAYAVESYYYLKFIDSKKLKRIMRQNVSSLRKTKDLINAVNKRIFDGNFPPL